MALEISDAHQFGCDRIPANARMPRPDLVLETNQFSTTIMTRVQTMISAIFEGNRGRCTDGEQRAQRQKARIGDICAAEGRGEDFLQHVATYAGDHGGMTGSPEAAQRPVGHNPRSIAAPPDAAMAAIDPRMTTSVTVAQPALRSTPIAETIQGPRKQADHKYFAVREVDKVQNAVDHAQAKGETRA